MTARTRKTPTAKTPAAPAEADSASADPAVCVVEYCTEPEFEQGRGLCGEHFATRLDLREAARHD